MTHRKLEKQRAVAPALPDHIARSIAKAPHAHLVVRDEADRLKVLPDIASLHTRSELAKLEGIGPAAIRKLIAWLAHHGRRPRNTSESLDTVICKLEYKSIRRKGVATNPSSVSAFALEPA
jgi:hypothetical protein